MVPILLIHGYASEGDGNALAPIYGSLPDDLRRAFGDAPVLDLNLSRWISLNDGVALDDVSFAMERALRTRFPQLLASGFHAIIHSTGALVVRNWIRLFSPKPCPIQNLVHLAGANLGSGLAHVGRGQLARWARALQGAGRGVKVLDELEFGSWKTIDLHRHFLQPGNDMRRDYRTQEFCLIGSQTLPALRSLPIRYVKEDSSDSTVRTSAGNLNFNYVAIRPTPAAYALTAKRMAELKQQRFDNETLDTSLYAFDLSGAASTRAEVPYCVAFETAHFGEALGIVSGANNRDQIAPLVVAALRTPYDEAEYAAVADRFRAAMRRTFEQAKKLKSGPLEWNKQQQYEGHAQLVFRLRDQYGVGIEHFDITLKSTPERTTKRRLERMIEDKHLNARNHGTIVFYLRTQSYDKKTKEWVDLLDDAASVRFEITAHEAHADNIDFAPVSVKLTPTQLRTALQSFRTTIIDVTLLRLPAPNVFAIKRAAER